MSPAQFNQAVTPISLVLNCPNSFFRPHYTQSFLLVTIVLQSFPTQKRTSNHLRLLVWTSPLNPPSLFCLPFLLPRKFSRIQLRLTSHLLHLYKLLTILQLQSQMRLCLPQLDYSSQFRCLKPINLKLQKNFFQLVHSYRTFDPFFHASFTSNFSLIILLLDVSIAVNTRLITHGEQNDPASISIYNTTSNQISPHGK